jgi:hypothetical protein
MKIAKLIVEVPESLKYRLDRTVLEERTTIKDKVTRLLEENLPEYKQE